MFENDFDPLVLSFLTEITFLQDFLAEGTVEEVKEKKKRDNFFKYERSGDKRKRKMEKQRLIAENIVKQEEEKEEKRDKFVIHRKIVDGLQRLFFLILRDKMKNKFKSTFIGLSKYKKFIRNEFLEGLYVLLNDAIAISDYESKLYGIITTLEIYFTYKYDFKRLVEALYDIICPFNYNLKHEDFGLIEKCIEELFINYKQPIQRVFAIVHRLIILRCLRYSVKIKKIIQSLANVYEIDFSDCFVTKEENYLINIDNFKNFPFYDYFLFKKML
ncbi:hypothetical protein NBO_169g0002 [Nosema bombycis CQ1]|uniref:Uncharacterized protein n=1 Tax=Nosema bombycis (strain CQ1 / CVCC 102059) TaxID=578461 RepID=R0MG64_NOSB1|nr:hypothetical protein NBO_169g0002 [Nosema bombycis CQ1]|eukprot:EOB13125.1 hypothetical protein NBO_169g0002 [Nosema bombycis CQ1]